MFGKELQGVEVHLVPLDLQLGRHVVRQQVADLLVINLETNFYTKLFPKTHKIIFC